MSLTACWSSRVLRQICLSGIGFVTAARADIPVDTGTNLSIGPAVYVTPSYPGASSTRGFALPYIDAEFNNLLYSNAADLLGIYAYKSPTANLGAAIQYDFTERLGKDDYRLRFLKDIKATPRGKLFASKTIGIITGDVNVATDLANRGQGTLAQANLWVTIPFIKNWIFSVGPGVTWADHQYMSTFFAVTPEMSALAPLSTYATKAGVVDLHWNGISLSNFVALGYRRVGLCSPLTRRCGEQSHHAASLANHRTRMDRL